MIHGMSGRTQAYLCFTQINSIRFNFIGIVELIMCLKFFENKFKIKVLKVVSLKFGNFELRFLNLEILNWNFKIKNLNFEIGTLNFRN